MKDVLALKPARLHSLLRVAHHLQTNWEAIEAQGFDGMLPRAHAAPSPLHGTGLFASEPLEPGTVAALYPMHALGDSSTCLTCDADGADAAHFGGGGADWPYRIDLPVSPRLEGWAEDLWIDSNPARDARAGWLGHLVNEGETCAGGSDEQIVDYYEATLARANCFLVPFGDTPLMCWATTKPVGAGEELLGVYGHDYWVARALGAVPAYTERVLRAAREWKRAVGECRARVQAEYAEEVRAIEELFDYADAEARAEAGGGGGMAPRRAHRTKRRVVKRRR